MCLRLYQRWYREVAPKYRKENIRRTRAKNRALRRLARLFPGEMADLYDEELSRA